MLEQEICRRCKSEIPIERQSQFVVVCPECGHSEEKRQRAFDSEIKFNINIWSVLTTVLIALSFIHVVNWDSHSLNIIRLKVKQHMVKASRAELESIAEICLDRGKPLCAEKALSQALEQIPQDEELTESLAKIQFQQGKYEEVVKTLSNYFSNNGKGLEQAYMYAVALGKINQLESSIKYFDYVLQAKPKKIQITVIQNYVNMLWQNGEIKKAINLIQKTRKKSSTASYFMESEYTELKKIILAQR